MQFYYSRVCFISVENIAGAVRRPARDLFFARWGRSPDRAPTHLKRTHYIMRGKTYDR